MTQNWIVDRPISLKEFISIKLSLSGGKAKQLIDSRNVFVNDRRVWMSGHLLNKGDKVSAPVPQSEKLQSQILPEIIYEDPYVFAVNKPAGMMSNDSPKSLEKLFQDSRKSSSIKIIHRLDEDTTGTLLIAKNSEAFNAYKNLWQEKAVEKTYLSICFGEPLFQTKIIEQPIENKTAKSDIQLISKNNGYCALKVQIETGRKHQIRIHLASIRHPVVGDGVYGPKTVEDPRIQKIQRQMLHAYSLSWTCPFTGKNIHLNSPIPADFRNTAELLGLTLPLK